MGCGVEGGEAAAVREGVERCFGGRAGSEGAVGELTGVVRAGERREVEVRVEVRERNAGMHEARGGGRRTWSHQGEASGRAKLCPGNYD